MKKRAPEASWEQGYDQRDAQKYLKVPLKVDWLTHENKTLRFNWLYWSFCDSKLR